MENEQFILTKKINHVAFIMDGNGRWAKARGLERHEGHKEGCERIIDIMRACIKYDINVMTLYAFSTENWNRPQDEINHLFNYLDDFFNRYINEFKKEGIRVQTMGDLTRLPLHSQKTIEKAKEMTKENTKFVFNIGLNYGSKQELAKACREIALDAKNGLINIDSIDENTINNHLYTYNLPPIDLMIRTSGEQRLSNYLLFQLAYSEFVFTKTYWPDFRENEFIECLKEFEGRKRRFGGLENK